MRTVDAVHDPEPLLFNEFWTPLCRTIFLILLLETVIENLEMYAYTGRGRGSVHNI